MKIQQISICNFRSIAEETILFPESGILTLVGPNNAGKSNILRAIDNVLGDAWFSGDRAELNDHFMRKKENKISIEIIFDDQRKVVFNSDEKWPVYLDFNGNKINAWSRNIPSDSTGNVKDDFPCTYFPANRDLAKNMQFRSYELMGKISKAFNSKIDESTAEALEDKFSEIMVQLDSIQEFSSFKKDFSNFFDELQSDSPYKLKVDFKAFTPLNYFKTINILANDSSVNGEFDIDPVELGEGNKSLMLFALIRSYAKNFKNEATGILAIEEPEIFLHPQARRHLYQVFKEIVKESNIQIIYTTHSPDFLSTEEFSSIGIVSKDSRLGTKVKTVTEKEMVQFSTTTGVPKDKVSLGNIKDYYATTSDEKLNEGFFAKHLVLVEGDTEELCFPLLFERLGFSYYSSGISVIGVEGKNQLPKYWRLFKSFDLKMSVVFDCDSEGNSNLATCFGFNEDDLTNINVTKKIEAENQSLFVFEADFETAFKKDFNNDEKWSEYEQEAIEKIRPILKGGRPTQQKGQIARSICKKILEDATYTPQFLAGLVKEIQDSHTVIRLQDVPF